MAQSKLTIDDAPLKDFHLRMGALAAGGPFCDGFVLGASLE